MVNAQDIREHMSVVGSDDQPVGQVDKCEGDRIKLTRSSPNSGGEHHYIPLASVERIDGDRVCLSMPAAQAMQVWETA